MRKAFCFFLSLLLIVASLSFFSSAAAGTTYYVDSVNGDDSNNGTSVNTPFKTINGFSRINAEFVAGDKILFKNGGTYECAATLSCSGTKDAPIVISSYGEGDTAVLYTNAKTEVLRLFDCSYITVSNLNITAPDGGGIWIDTLNKTSEGITLDNLYFYGIQNYKVNCRDNLSAGAAVARAAVMVKGLPARSRYAVNDLTITDCEIYDCANGISLWGSWNDAQNPGCTKEEVDPVFNENVLVKGCYFHEMDAEAIIVGICDGALVTDCRAINCCQGEGVNENGEPLYYTAAMWFWGSVNSTIQYCEIAGQKNVGDGMSIDFDSYSNYCTYQYIYSHDNTRFMNNCPIYDGQTGNTVRYCLSVNDNNECSRFGGRSGEHNFSFYNNTVINCGDFYFDNIYNSLVANNIIIPSDGNIIKYAGQMMMSGNTFKSNCYYNTTSPLFDLFAFNTVPGFETDGYSLSKNSPLIGAGFDIDGNDAEYDFFGNIITSNNIGCYGGDGIDCEYESENIFQKIVRLIGNFFDIIKSDIAALMELIEEKI